MERFCDSCGSLVNASGNVCPSCGGSIEAEFMKISASIDTQEKSEADIISEPVAVSAAQSQGNKSDISLESLPVYSPPPSRVSQNRVYERSYTQADQGSFNTASAPAFNTGTVPNYSAGKSVGTADAPMHMSMGQWLLTIFLTTCLGTPSIVLLIVWGFTRAAKEPRKSYCRAMLVFMGIAHTVLFWIFVGIISQV